MELLSLTALLAAILAIALLLEPLARRSRIPFGVLLVVGGFVGSEVALIFYDDLHIRWYDIHDFIIYLIIPVFLFQITLKLNPKVMLKSLAPIAILVIPITILSGLLIGLLLYLFLGYAGFPWHSAWIAGVLLSAVTAGAVPALKAAKTPERLVAIMGGEGLFNGAIAIILFLLLTETMNMDAKTFSMWDVGLPFLRTVLLGLAGGIAVGLVLTLLMRITIVGYRHALITFVGCFLSYFLASNILLASGAAAVLATSLILLRAMQRYGDKTSLNLTLAFWDYKVYLASASLYILMGISITQALITERWLAMIIAIVAVLAARASIVYLIMPMISRVPYVGVHHSWYPVLWWGHLRGGATIALALALPTQLEGWWTIQAMAYGVVLFSLAFQDSTLPWVIRRCQNTYENANRQAQSVAETPSLEKT